MNSYLRRRTVVPPDAGSSLRVMDARAVTAVAVRLGSGNGEAQGGSRLASRGWVCDGWLPVVDGCVGSQRPTMVEVGVRRWASSWPFVGKASRHWCGLLVDEVGVQVVMEVVLIVFRAQSYL